MYNALKPVNGKPLLTAIAGVAIFTVVIITSSCKKKEKDFTDRLQNKWGLVQMVDSAYTSTSLAPMVTPYEGQSGEYIQFLPDGRMCTYIKKAYDTVQYTFSEQNFKINVKNHKYNILILTDNAMILHEPKYSTSSGSGDYNAYKITLKR
jgi:hypothetical protein